jgi:ABC-type branched-subunit amino acid transport system substrate-binding protein
MPSVAAAAGSSMASLSQGKGEVVQILVAITVALACSWSGGAFAQDARGPILIGQSAALTGSQAEFGREIRDGANAYFEGVNRQGGIHGRPVRLLTLDDAGSEAKARENAVRLINEDKVMALFGFISRPSSVAGAKIASEAKVPFLGPFSGTPALYKFDPYVFTVRASYDDELAAMVQQLVATGHRKIGFAYLNDARAVNVPLVEKLLAQHDLKPTVLIGVDRASGEVGAQAKQLANANPEALLALANNLPLTALTREARKLGNTTPFWIVSFVDSKLMVKELGTDAAGQVFAQVVPLPTKRRAKIVKDYQRDYQAAFPAAQFSFTSFEGYIGARVLTEGLRKAGTNLNRDRVVKGLEAIGNMDLGDFWVDYSDKKHNGSAFVDLTIVNKNGNFLD